MTRSTESTPTLRALGLGLLGLCLIVAACGTIAEAGDFRDEVNDNHSAVAVMTLEGAAPAPEEDGDDFGDLDGDNGITISSSYVSDGALLSDIAGEAVAVAEGEGWAMEQDSGGAKWCGTKSRADSDDGFIDLLIEQRSDAVVVTLSAVEKKCENF